jgi:hypothetical protein
MLPHVYLSGKHAIFQKMDAQLETRIRINGIDTNENKAMLAKLANFHRATNVPRLNAVDICESFPDQSVWFPAWFLMGGKSANIEAEYVEDPLYETSMLLTKRLQPCMPITACWASCLQ